MTDSMSSAAPVSAAPASGDPQTLLRTITSTPDARDVLEQLERAGLVTRGRDLRERDVTPEATPTDLTGGEEVPGAVAAIGRVDPRQSRAALAGGKFLGMYVQDCLIATEAQPPYHRLPSFSSHFPYHIVYLLKFPANKSHTVNVTLQVYSAGTVRITGTGSPFALTLGQSSFPLTFPVAVKTTAQGFASILIQRVGATGFDWFASEVL